MSQPQTESYTAAKGWIFALTHAMAVSFSGKTRVNSISPGWIDTDYRTYEGSDAVQQPSGRVGNPKDIADMVLFLCSDKSHTEVDVLPFKQMKDFFKRAFTHT